MTSHSTIILFRFGVLAALFSTSHGWLANGANQRWSTGRLAASTVEPSTERDTMVQNLIDICRQVGQVGSFASQAEQDLVQSMAQDVAAFSDPNRARIPLTGTHDLIYSAAPGSSSGKLFGPFYGKVTQEFVDDETFVNRVTLGPLEAKLRATRNVVNDDTINVTFRETTLKLFGQTVLEKEINGGGVWKYLFSGQVRDQDGKAKLVRIMEAPSLFVLEQKLS